jgi:hypothetical protein
MPYSGMLHRGALVRTYVLEEHSASTNRVTRIGALGTTLAVTSNRHILSYYDIAFLSSVHQLLVTANVDFSSLIPVTLMMEVLHSSKTMVLTRAT